MKAFVRLLILVLISFTIAMCSSLQNDEKPTMQSSENFDWLLGNWKRTNDKNGKQTFENWKKISADEYSGVGFTLQNNDTISKEEMTLLKANNRWNFLVKVQDEKNFISFEMAEINQDNFECKNDSLDFPNRIKYWKNGNKINALVSGDSMKLYFEFERLQ